MHYASCIALIVLLMISSCKAKCASSSLYLCPRTSNPPSPSRSGGGSSSPPHGHSTGLLGDIVGHVKRPAPVAPSGGSVAQGSKRPTLSAHPGQLTHGVVVHPTHFVQAQPAHPGQSTHGVVVHPTHFVQAQPAHPSQSTHGPLVHPTRLVPSHPAHSDQLTQVHAMHPSQLAQPRTRPSQPTQGIHGHPASRLQTPATSRLGLVGASVRAKAPSTKPKRKGEWPTDRWRAEDLAKARAAVGPRVAWWKQAGGQPRRPEGTGPRYEKSLRYRERQKQKKALEGQGAQKDEHPSKHQPPRGGGPGSPGAGSQAVSKRKFQTG